MRTDLRVKHDVETRRRASELFERGYGRISTAKALRVPRQTVEKWQQIYRAIGREALLSMGREAGKLHVRAEGGRGFGRG